MTISLCWRRRLQGVNEIVFTSDSRLSAGYRWNCAQKIFLIEGPNFCVSFAGDADFVFQCSFGSNAWCVIIGATQTEWRLFQMTKNFLAIVNQMAALVDEKKLAQFTKTSFLMGGYHFDSGRTYQCVIRFNDTTNQYERKEFGGLRSGGKGFSIGFIGDERTAYFRILGKLIHEQQTELDFQPLEALSILLKSQDRNSAIGGSPQVVKVYRHRNYLPYAVHNAAGDDKITLFGRPLLPYERTFYPVISLDRIEQADFVHNPDMPKGRRLQPPPKIGDPRTRATLQAAGLSKKRPTEFEPRKPAVEADEE